MGTTRKIEDYPAVLVVEGYSDLAFYAEVLEHLGRHKTVFIQAVDGRGNIRQELKAILTPQRLAEKLVIGVIADSDSNPARFKQLCSAIQDPIREFAEATFERAGDWVTAGSYPCKLGVFIASNSQGEGEIESLVWESWRADEANSESVSCVENFLACMSGAGLNPQSPDKAGISALLAVRNDEDARLGPGAQRRIFNFDRPEFDSLKQFLSGFPLNPV